MNSSPKSAPLTETLAALSRCGVIPAAAAGLAKRLDTVERELRESVLHEIPAFSASGNPDVIPQLGAHSARHLDEIRRLFAGGNFRDLDFVTDHARSRAEQRFPLEATLHAYRCGHKVISRWLRDAALESADPSVQVRKVVATIADFAIEYTDYISTIATSEYVSHTRLLSEAEGDRRTELLTVLLKGYDEADGRVASLLRRSGYLEQRQSYCVVVAQAVDPSEMDNPARARRLAESLSRTVGRMGLRYLVGIREHVVTAVLSDTRRTSGWTPQQSALAARIRPHLRTLGTAALIGVSDDVPSTSFVPRANDEAKLALEFASVSNRVVEFSDIPVREVVLRQAQTNMRSALPAWVDRFGAIDRKARGSLRTTLMAYADADMNVLRAAKALDVHPNTIYSRLQKIADTTGKNGLVYHDLTDLLLAMDVVRTGRATVSSFPSRT